MTAYTKGPWRAVETRGAMNFPIIAIEECISGHYLQVASVSNSTAAAAKIPVDAIEANARLMAAAPELLEALKAIFEHNCFSPMAGDVRVYRLSLQAIAKAEGK
jgi:hypothetical protein